MSEKSTRKAPDYAVESTAARNRSVFQPKLRRWSSQTAEERYNSSESGLKKEIPVKECGLDLGYQIPRVSPEFDPRGNTTSILILSIVC